MIQFDQDICTDLAERISGTVTVIVVAGVVVGVCVWIQRLRRR